MVLKDNKTYITFHSGILTIGGTVIEVAYNDSHIFFDFGTEYRPELGLKEESLDTLLKHRLVPELSIYDQRFNKGKDDFSHTAVFLSHAHLDHSKMINYLDQSIPLYMLDGTRAVLKTMNEHGEFLIPSPFEKKNWTREMTGVEENTHIQVGEIDVEIVPVDHDAYGACGLIIKTPDKKLVYTGDLRLHGFRYELTPAFCKKAYHTDALMMEGVSISFPEKAPAFENEPALLDEFCRLVAENPDRQISFNGYPANVDRFVQIVKRSPRQVVLNARMAALLLETHQLQVPYYYAPEQEKFESLDEALAIPFETLIDDHGQYLFQIEQETIQYLKEGGLYLHSDAQPLGAFDPAYQPFLDDLAQRNIEFVRIALSGHAFAEDLDKIIAMIQPKLLLPIHTLKPEKLENPYGERILPERGQTIELS